MARDDDLTIAYRVKGTLLDEESYIPSKLTEYDIVVHFSDVSDHEEETGEYLSWYANVDLKKEPDEAIHYLNNWNCAKGLSKWTEVSSQRRL